MIIKRKRTKQVLKVVCDKNGIENASRIINNGGIAVFPTDTTYGIGCDPYNKEAVKKIYDIKNRERSKPFPVLVHSKEMAEKIILFDNFSKKIVERFWPGALTIVLPSSDTKLKDSLGVKEKIAVRVPNHKCTLDLLEKCNLLVGTSANISGESSVTDPNECMKNLQNYDVFVDGGPIISKGESTIIEIDNEKIKVLREGALSKKEILGI